METKSLKGILLLLAGLMMVGSVAQAAAGVTLGLGERENLIRIGTASFIWATIASASVAVGPYLVTNSTLRSIRMTAAPVSILAFSVMAWVAVHEPIMRVPFVATVAILLVDWTAAFLIGKTKAVAGAR